MHMWSYLSRISCRSAFFPQSKTINVSLTGGIKLAAGVCVCVCVCD